MYRFKGRMELCLGCTKSSSCAQENVKDVRTSSAWVQCGCSVYLCCVGDRTLYIVHFSCVDAFLNTRSHESCTFHLNRNTLTLVHNFSDGVLQWLQLNHTQIICLQGTTPYNLDLHSSLQLDQKIRATVLDEGRIRR